MDQNSGSERAEKHNAETPSFRVLLRIIMALYLVSLPACVQDAGHFGPGFFPLIAALVLVPVFSVVAFMDAMLLWSDAVAERKFRETWRSCMLTGLVALGYGAVIALVIYERSN